MAVSSVTTLSLRGGGFAPQSQHQQQQSQSNSTSSTTITQTTNNLNSEVSLATPVLRLRGIATNPTTDKSGNGRHIQWHESVINNEGMGKKKSKVCCIYHAPRAFGESSDESSSSEGDSSCDEGSDDGNGNSNRDKGASFRNSHHGHQHDCDGPRGENYKNRKGRIRKKDRSPNAYEKMPRSRNPRGETVKS